MSEYISKSAVHDLIKSLPRYQMFNYDHTKSLIGISPDGIDFAVDAIPAAEVVEVRHGAWIKEPPYTSVGGDYKKAIICSECNSFFVSEGNTPWRMHNYCPNCGAKMDKE